MLLYFRFYISTVVNSLEWLFSTVNLQPKKFFFTVFCFAPVVRECFYLYTAFGCHYREIHHAILGKTIAFTVSATVHFGVWAFFLDYHFIEITSSSKILSVLYYQSLSVYNYSAKANNGAIGTFPSQRPFQWFLWNSRTIFKHYTTHSGVIYSRLIFLRSFSFIYFLNRPTAP